MIIEDGVATLELGDCIEAMREMPENSIDSIVTDPPYGLVKQPDIRKVLEHWLKGESFGGSEKGFMGKTWDSFVPGPGYWEEVYRVLKPGGHLLSFAGTRTVDLLGIALRFGGFEIRDTLMWVYGSGFAKSKNISKAIDEFYGAERPVIGRKKSSLGGTVDAGERDEGKIQKHRTRYHDVTGPATPEAQKWNGWGTGLRPSWEPIILSRKPIERNVVQNILKWGTGGMNLSECNIPGGDTKNPSAASFVNGGRLPINLVHSGEPEVEALFPRGAHESTSRFFYFAKPSETDRTEGLDELRSRYANTAEGQTVYHPTVKPTTLMRYLVRLVTPAGGTVLDPFMGSGSTGKAAVLEGFRFVGIEQDELFVEMSKARIQYAVENRDEIIRRLNGESSESLKHQTKSRKPKLF